MGTTDAIPTRAGPVVKWISRKPPKLEAHVRFMAGPPSF